MLTVLLATRNRPAILRQTLEVLCCLQMPSSGWKLVIVDNGSTDQTSTVLASFATRLPLHTVFEPTVGKNYALNAGLGLITGDLVVFTDDDAFPHTNWLTELRKAADEHPEYAIFGGAVVPRWESPPPDWVQWFQWLHLGATYALTDPLWQEGPIQPDLVFGPNMAIRTAVFQLGARFDPSIGPRSSSYYAMGSETELILRLSRQGYNAWHVPSAVVEHFIRNGQLEKAWILKRAIRFGRGCFRGGDVERKYEGLPRLFGVPRTFFRQIWREEKSIVKAWLKLNERKLLFARWRRNYLWGQMIEAYLRHRRRSNRSIM